MPGKHVSHTNIVEIFFHLLLYILIQPPTHKVTASRPQWKKFKEQTMNTNMKRNLIRVFTVTISRTKRTFKGQRRMLKGICTIGPNEVRVGALTYLSKGLATCALYKKRTIGLILQVSQYFIHLSFHRIMSSHLYKLFFPTTSVNRPIFSLTATSLPNTFPFYNSFNYFVVHWLHYICVFSYGTTITMFMCV